MKRTEVPPARELDVYYRDAIKVLDDRRFDSSGRVIVTCPVKGCGQPLVVTSGEKDGLDVWSDKCHCDTQTLDTAITRRVLLLEMGGYTPRVWQEKRRDPPPDAEEEPPPGQGVSLNGHAPRAAKEFRLLSFGEALSLESPEQMIEDFLQEQSIAQIYGESNHGKTLLAADCALNVARASETWFGRKINKPGPVVWINADGGLGFTDRLKAWVEAHGSELAHPFLTLYGNVHLGKADQMTIFRQQLLSMDERPVLVVVDTLSRCIPGVDENNQGEMTRVMEQLHATKLQLECTILLIHHTDKSGQWDRGSSVVKSECDTQIRVTWDKGQRVGTVSCVKARDAAPFNDFYFSLHPVGPSVIVMQNDSAPPVDKAQVTKDRLHELTVLVLDKPGIGYDEAAEILGCSDRTVERDAEKLESLKVILRHDLPSTGGRPRVGLYPVPATPDPRL